MTPEEKSRMVRFVTSPEFERGYDRGRKLRIWARENKTALTLGAIALAATTIWIYRQRATTSHFSVSGVWTDLAKKQGIAVGTDLSIQEVQQYLNVINGKRSPSEGGTGLAEDGILGTKTSNAIRAFQAGNGLEQTGAVDEETGNALSYFVAAVSKSPEMRKFATVTPKTIASITPPPKRRKLLPAIDIGGGWVMYGSCGCKWDDAACAARCGGAQPSLPPPSLSTATEDFRTGIQSTSMYDPRNYYTDAYGAWVLPMSREDWWHGWS